MHSTYVLRAGCNSQQDKTFEARAWLLGGGLKRCVVVCVAYYSLTCLGLGGLFYSGGRGGGGGGGQGEVVLINWIARAGRIGVHPNQGFGPCMLSQRPQGSQIDSVSFCQETRIHTHAHYLLNISRFMLNISQSEVDFLPSFKEAEGKG